MPAMVRARVLRRWSTGCRSARAGRPEEHLKKILFRRGTRARFKKQNSSGRYPRFEKSSFRRRARGRFASDPIRGRRAFSAALRSEEPASELQSLIRISYAVFFLTNKPYNTIINKTAKTINKSTHNNLETYI